MVLNSLCQIVIRPLIVGVIGDYDLPPTQAAFYI
jgi:hypothetical protein